MYHTSSILSTYEPTIEQLQNLRVIDIFIVIVHSTKTIGLEDWQIKRRNKDYIKNTNS